MSVNISLFLPKVVGYSTQGVSLTWASRLAGGQSSQSAPHRPCAPPAVNNPSCLGIPGSQKYVEPIRAPWVEGSLHKFTTRFTPMHAKECAQPSL